VKDAGRIPIAARLFEEIPPVQRGGASSAVSIIGAICVLARAPGVERRGAPGAYAEPIKVLKEDVPCPASDASHRGVKRKKALHLYFKTDERLEIP